MRFRHGCLAVLLLSLCACHATRQPLQTPANEGNASWHLVVPPDGSRYELSVDQTASGSSPITRVSPVYPEEELAQCAPSVDVQAQLVVDDAGRVSDVRVNDEAQADEHRHRYIDAVRKAAVQWTFSPLYIDKWVERPDGTKHVQSSETKPFSLMYAFHFDCHDGHASTSMGKAPSP